MKPFKTIKNGKDVWCIDLRAVGKGRVFDFDRQTVIDKANKLCAGVDQVEFTTQDMVAKKELLASRSGATLIDCVRYYLGRERIAPKECKLSVAIPQCVAAKKAEGAREAYYSHFNQILGQFMIYTGDIFCHDVRATNVEGFLCSKKWADETRNGMRRRLSAFFGWCMEKKQSYCSFNPCEDVKAIKLDQKEPDIFSVDDVRRVLDTTLVLDPAMIPYYVAGIFGGIRPEEIQKLVNWDKQNRQPRALQMDADHIFVPAECAKGRKKRIVELSDNAMDWLRAAGSRPLFWSRNRHREIKEAAGVAWSCDIMRHTFATYHMALHESADKTAIQMGHYGGTRMLHQRYDAGGMTKATAQQFWNIRPAVSLVMIPNDYTPSNVIQLDKAA